MLNFIGDVHGNIPTYLSILKRIDPKEYSIQIGDMGIGLNGIEYFGSNLPTRFEEKAVFIRGNHDDPTLARLHPNCIGDFGFWHGVFYVSGAETSMRFRKDKIPGISWFEEEELSSEQWDDVKKLYFQVMPRIVASHDCPEDIAERFFKKKGSNRTRAGLQALFEQHQPDYWIFGHHHHKREERVNGTIFISLDVLEHYRLIPWWEEEDDAYTIYA